MRSGDVAYVDEVGSERRIFEVVIVPDWPRKRGKPYKCVVDPSAQRILISAHVPTSERAGVIGRTLASRIGLNGDWSVVPVVGKVS